jgi:EpsI family protein
MSDVSALLKGINMIKSSRFVIVFILLAGAGLYINLHADITVPMNKPFSQFPLAIKEWKMVSQAEFSATVLDVLKPTDYLYRTYAGGDGRQAQLYIGYHGGGKGGGEIHSPKHCLPGSGWYEATTRKTSLDVGGRTIDLVETVYQKGDSKELFLYWFQVKERSITNEYSLKLSEIVNSMLYRRRDASFVRISVPVVQGELEQATTTGEKFVRDVYPAIREFLPG